MILQGFDLNFPNAEFSYSQEHAQVVLDGGEAGAWSFDVSGNGRAPSGIVRRFDVSAPVDIFSFLISFLS